MLKTCRPFFGFCIIILPFLFFSSGICDETDQPVLELNLKKAIGLAFSNNKDILIQEKEITAAKADILYARSVFYPQLNANASYTHNGSNLSSFLSTSTQSKKDIGVFTGYQNDNILGVTLSELLYDGGANIANLRQSQLGLKVQEETLRAKKLDVEFEAKRLYYGLLLAIETERIMQNLFDQAEAHYEDVRNKYDQGTSSRFDLLQSKVQVSKVVPELVKAKNAVKLITAELGKLLGVNVYENIRPKEVLGYKPIEIKEKQFLKTAYLNQPEMILKSLGIDISKWSIQMAKAGYRPQITTQLNYIMRSNNYNTIFDKRHYTWNAGVAVSIPIFDGFSSKAKVDAARAKYNQALLQKENVSEQVVVDIKKSCLDLKESEAIINSQKDNVSEAKEALAISEISYDNGEGTNLDVLDAQVSLSQIEQNLAEGIYDYLMAEASLNRTMGRSTIETNLVAVTEAKNEKTN